MTIHNEDGKNKQSTVYSWASAATGGIAGTAAGTDLTGITGFTTLLTNFTSVGRRPRRISLTATGTVYVKINGGDVITIGATTPFEADDLVINSISISDGNSSQTLTVFLQ